MGKGKRIKAGMMKPRWMKPFDHELHESHE